MKKLLFTALVAVSLTASAFATDESKISVRIRENFKMDFKGIEKVDWSLRNNFVKASFMQDGEIISAFYDFKGDLIGKSHHIAVDDLPLNAKRIFAKKYGSYNVTEAVQYTGTDESAFYISVENEKENLILKITDTSSISIFTKNRKK